MTLKCYNYPTKYITMAAQLSNSSLQFLKELSANNDREWFAKNKPTYEKANKEFKAFMAEVEEELNAFDSIEKTKVFRIYRDVRFSKNKAPYKINFSGGFTREGKHRRGGFFFGFEPDISTVAGGFWNPESKDLKNIREGILREEDRYRKLIDSNDIKEFFGGIQGDSLKTAPKGFDKNHPSIELVRNKQFLLYKRYTEKEVCAPGFAKTVAKTYQKMIPYFQFMTDQLIFDENGVERT